MRRPIAAAFALLLVASAGAARAQPLAAPDPDVDPGVDPLVPTGAALIGVGAVAGLIGAKLSIDGARQDLGQQLCGLNGCLTAPERPAHPLGSLFIGGAAGMGIAGTASVLVGASGVLPREERASEGGVMAGAWLTGIGAGLVGSSIATAIALRGAVHPEPTMRSSIAVFAVGGGALVAGGLVVAGRAARGEKHAVRPVSRPGRAYAGMVMTTLGVPLLLGAVGSAAYFGGERGDFVGLAYAVVTVPLALGGLGLVAPGIPLWATGTSKPAVQLSGSIGPGGATVGGSF